MPRQELTEEVAYEIAAPLTSLFNISLQYGSYVPYCLENNQISLQFTKVGLRMTPVITAQSRGHCKDIRENCENCSIIWLS